MQQIKDAHTVALPLPCANLDTPDTSRPEGLTLVHINDVYALPQIRTDSGMDDASLKELAESIKRNGLLQLPLLRFDESPKEAINWTNSHTPKYAVVAGHRRIEAMRRAGYETFYAIVGTTEDSAAFEMQLAENIHREQLSLKEIAAAIRNLYDQGKKPAAIGEIVKKSKAWVSKHLSLTCEDFSKVAYQMLVSGECEDLETLGIINQLSKMGAHETIQELRDNPPITRKKAAAALKAAKDTAMDNAASQNDGDQEATAQETPNPSGALKGLYASDAIAAIIETQTEAEDDLSMTEADALWSVLERLFGQQEDIMTELDKLRTRVTQG
jgi:ParB family chromosome partitioning protein